MLHKILPITLLLALGVNPACADDPYASAPAYAKAVSGSGTRSIQPIVTTGQQIPLTGGAAGSKFRFLGIPDGIGYYQSGNGEIKLLINHEFRNTNGTPFGTLPNGARVSELTINTTKGGSKSSASIVSGKLAFDRVYGPDASGNYSEVTPTAGFSRFCSANMAKQDVGFDRPIYMAGEENSPLNFDGKGGQTVAIFDNKAHLLPQLGRMDFENAVVAPFTGNKTVSFETEDGGTLGSQLYMYVGEKDASSSDPLKKNGLVGGKLYVLAINDPALNSEATVNVKGQSTSVRFVEVNAFQTDAQLQTESQNKGSYNFTRIEDNASDKKTPGVQYFVTTGTPGVASNPFGKLYKLEYNPADPAHSTAKVTVLLDGSEGIVSPDNIDINKHGELVMLEDPNYNLSQAPLNLTRDSSVWLYNTNSGELARIAQLDRDAARAHALAADPLNSNAASSDTPGGWELSGVVDAEDILGRGSWLLDVQAHSLRINPIAETVEGGQLLHVVWKPLDQD